MRRRVLVTVLCVVAFASLTRATVRPEAVATAEKTVEGIVIIDGAIANDDDGSGGVTFDSEEGSGYDEKEGTTTPDLITDITDIDESNETTTGNNETTTTGFDITTSPSFTKPTEPGYLEDMCCPEYCAPHQPPPGTCCSKDHRQFQCNNNERCCRIITTPVTWPWMIVANVALGATLVIAIAAIVSVCYKRRDLCRNGRSRGERDSVPRYTAEEFDGGSSVPQDRIVEDRQRDYPPSYDAVAADPKPPSYANLQQLQGIPNLASSSPTSPGIWPRNRQSSNASNESNPPPYDSVFSVSLQLEQNLTFPNLQNSVEGATAVATERQEQTLHRVIGNESQDEEEIYSRITSSFPLHMDEQSSNPPNDATEGFVNPIFYHDEREIRNTDCSR